MTFSLEELATVVGVIAAIAGGVVGVARVAIALGELRRTLQDLAARHAELAKEMRERVGAAEHRTNGLERWQAAVDARLSGIHDALVEIRTILSDRRREGE